LRAKTCGVVHGPEPDDFAVAVGEGVLRLGHLAAGAGLVEHAHYLLVAEESLRMVVNDFSATTARNAPTSGLA
jgi:hypothetical protein